LKAKHRPKDGLSRFENLNTQPHHKQKIFNNHEILTKGWYPVCASSELKTNSVSSFKIFRQRIVVYRGESGEVYALDAFCPHLGADLGNGRVKGENVQCYFHQWEFNGSGQLEKIPCLEKLDPSLSKLKTHHYPVQEKYGHIWVFAGESATHDVINPPALLNEKVSAWYLKEITLFAHHHVMMANGVDLQHFATVHALDIKFDYNVSENDDDTFVWNLKGKIPDTNLKGKLARFFLGDTFEYEVKFAGASLIAISYGKNAKFLGKPFPALNVLWGCLPQESGVSKVRIFFVTKKRKGLTGNVKNFFLYGFTMLLLMMLRDEDIEAFPNMRFNTNRLIEADKSLARFIQLINKSQISSWGRRDDS
tara:strand:- start:5670 stop:6761 length:1092 start_codon:yes stop_codon:yes gene_type:complete